MKVALVSVALVLICQSLLIAGENKTTINLLTLLPYYNPDPSLDPAWNDGDNIQPAMELAKDQINSNPSILEKYTLELIHAHSGCDIPVETEYSFSKEAFPRSNSSVRMLTGVIGPGCSSSSIALAPFTNRSEIGLVTVHLSGTPILADRVKYRYMLSILGSSESYVKGFLYILEKSDWKRVAILYDELTIYFQYVQELLVETLHANTTVKVNPLLLTTLNSIPLGTIQQSPVRIIFVMCPLKLSQHIICLSKYNRMIYEKYQWAFIHKTLEELVQPVNFIYKGVRYECSAGDMANALEKAILLSYRLAESSEVELVSNITYKQYLTEYGRYREDYNKRANITRNSTYTHWAALLYDAVWAWALVLDNLTKTSASFNISGSHYGNFDQTQMIVKQFYKISFQGASGKVSFSEDTGFIQRQVNFFQIINGSDKLFAIVGKDRVNISEPKFIPDTFPNVVVRSSKALAIFFNLMTVVQFLIVVILHVATLMNLKQPSIKASSPRLLYITYAGVYIVALGAFTWTLFSAASIRLDLFGAFCQFFWAWCLPIGFTLSFGPVAMRTWRVYRIFVHYLNPGPLISDPVLICGVLLLLVVDVIIAVIWTAVNSFDDTIDNKLGQDDVLKVKAVCDCRYHSLWISIITLYKIGLFIIVTVLSLLTINITNRPFATTALRVFVYVMTFFSLLGFSLFFIISNPIYHNITMSVLLNSIIMLFTVFIFVPPLFPVFRQLHN